MAKARNLVTVLVHPQETMRRILAERDRWAPQIVFLAFLCASVQDPDARALDHLLPGLGPSAIALLALGLIAGALAWLGLLFLLSWIAAFIGRRMGGTAPTSDVRAAMAWGLVPVIWSPVYRIPFALMEHRIKALPGNSAMPFILDFIAGGGCSFVIVYLALQLAFMLWCVFVASGTIAEAQQFSLGKGFVNVAATLAVPLVIVAAAVAASHFQT